MDMAPVVNAYFEAERAFDASALAEIFAVEAVVADEGVVYRGIEAIRAWWMAAKEKYHHVAEPIEVTGSDSKVSVRTRVTGQFPNSPITLALGFTLSDNKIVRLEIQ